MPKGEIQRVSGLVGNELRRAFPDLSDANSQEWLRAIYQNRAARFASDNDAIWKTGAVMIPVSLGAFIVPMQVNLHSVWQELVLAIASIGLMFLWLMISVNLRAFQDKAVAEIIAIERDVVGYHDPAGPKVIEFPNWMAGMTTSLAGFYTNWALFGFVVVGWVALLLFVPVDP